MTPEALMKDFIDKNRIAGAGLIVRRDGVELVHSLQGYADIERKIPVTDDTLFRLCSMSKPITAVAVMQLIERGDFEIRTNPAGL